MLRELLEVSRKKPKLYQVLFLKNDGDQSVEVEEVEQIDFVKIKEHLERGDSIFITNRRTQKFKIPEPKNSTFSTPSPNHPHPNPQPSPFLKLKFNLFPLLLSHSQLFVVSFVLFLSHYIKTS